MLPRKAAFGDFAKALTSPWSDDPANGEPIPRACLSCGNRAAPNPDGSLPCGH